MTGKKPCSNVKFKFRNFFIFVVVENIKVKVPGGIEQFIGLQGNGT